MATDLRPDADPRPDLQKLSLFDFIPAVTPGCFPPYHFRPLVEVLEKAPGGNLQCVMSAPCQHGKSTTVRHAVALWHVRDPKLHVMYITYGQEFSEINSRDIRRIQREAGVRISKQHDTIKGWSLEQGGEFVATSIDGRATGMKANIVVFDDPFKGPEEAYSLDRRNQVYDKLRYEVIPRMAPGGSIFIIASRWDDDDLSGRAIKLQGFDEIRLEAVNSITGHALCPDGPDPREPRTLDFLDQIRYGRKDPITGLRKGGIGEHAWAALYQGRPIPRSGALFKDARFYDELPAGAKVKIIGCDIATSAGARSDFSVAVAIAEFSGVFFIVDVWRVQQAITHVEAMLCAARDAHKVNLASYVSGQEIGIFDLLFHRGLSISRMPARWSKYVRAQRTAIAWNQGRILLRKGADWLDWFVPEVTHFTGNDDAHDDGVDAMVSGIDALEGQDGSGWTKNHGFTFGSRVM